MKCTGKILILFFLLSLHEIIKSYKIENFFNNQITDCTGIPNNCEGDISLVVDASSDGLNDELFNIEKYFIKNYLSSNWNDYTKIYLSWYNKEAVTVNNFGTPNQKDYFNRMIDSIPLNRGTNITRLLEFLSKNSIGNRYVSTIVFVSSVIQDDLMKAKVYADDLKSMGSLIFVILGNLITIQDMSILNPTTTIQWHFTNETAEGVANGVFDNLSCSSKCTGGGPTTLTTTSFTPVTKPNHPKTTPQTHRFTGIPPINHKSTPQTHRFTGIPPFNHKSTPKTHSFTGF